MRPQFRTHLAPRFQLGIVGRVCGQAQSPTPWCPLYASCKLLLLASRGLDGCPVTDSRLEIQLSHAHLSTAPCHTPCTCGCANPAALRPTVSPFLGILSPHFTGLPCLPFLGGRPCPAGSWKGRPPPSLPSTRLPSPTLCCWLNSLFVAQIFGTRSMLAGELTIEVSQASPLLP